MPIDYVISARKIKNNRFIGEPGRVRFLRVPREAEIPLPEHRVRGKRELRAWVNEVRDLADGDLNPNSISVRGDVLIFIHGYNNDLEIIMKRQRRLASDLRAEGWRGVVIGFDWPSEDNALNYLEDRSDAAAVAEYLVSKGVKALVEGQEGRGKKDDKCVTNVHLIGHSTGAFVIMEAFAQADKVGEFYKSQWRIGQVVFIGGDVASASLSTDEDWSGPMFHRIMRLTNYSNPFDTVLAVSNAKRLGVRPRVGRVGLPENNRPKAINVDCGEYFKTLDPARAHHYGTFNHSWHIGDPVFTRDLAMTLEGAIDRHAIPTRSNANGKLELVDENRPANMAGWNIRDDLWEVRERMEDRVER